MLGGYEGDHYYCGVGSSKDQLLTDEWEYLWDENQ